MAKISVIKQRNKTEKDCVNVSIIMCKSHHGRNPGTYLIGNANEDLHGHLFGKSNDRQFVPQN